MNIGEKIDHTKFDKGHRPFEEMSEFVNIISKNHKIWSWGTHAWTKMSKFCLRFKVTGHHHKGHVYIVVNVSDLFDVYFTTTHGKIKKIENDIYIEDFIDRLDIVIEKIDAYNR